MQYLVPDKDVDRERIQLLLALPEMEHWCKAIQHPWSLEKQDSQVSFASLFCGMFEHQFVLNPGVNDFLRHIVLWKRYIDDVFLIWSGTESELLEFHSLVNNKCSALKFTIEFHQEKMIF